ncbi:heterokaryon incompatibility protein-domain-containing protein [Tricladium varicosporioides]|nr:heterokaryon incompatibility protein-domain-containing protein [Hymenoscyphus varicosporioides]
MTGLEVAKPFDRYPHYLTRSLPLPEDEENATFFTEQANYVPFEGNESWVPDLAPEFFIHAINATPIELDGKPIKRLFELFAGRTQSKPRGNWPTDAVELPAQRRQIRDEDLVNESSLPQRTESQERRDEFGDYLAYSGFIDGRDEIQASPIFTHPLWIDEGPSSRRILYEEPFELSPRASLDFQHREPSPPLRLKYRSLNADSDEIRLITLKKSAVFSAAANPIECTLQYVSQTKAPRYEALSYCWGDPNNLLPILLDGCMMYVTANLFAALQHLRLEQGLPLWIDAICINQQDIEERSHQVLRMNSIYSKAARVISWIGESSEDDKLASHLMSTVGTQSEEHLYARAALRLGPNSQNSRLEGVFTTGGVADELGFEDALRYDNRFATYQDYQTARWYLNWIAFNKFLNATYWKRTWIIQELVVAREIEIRVGYLKIPWKWLEKTIETVDDDQLGATWNPIFTPSSGFLNVNGIRGLCMRRRSGDGLRLLEALSLSWFSQATDPRDKVFALLSLAVDGPEIIPNPNYEGTVESLFEQVTRGIILRSKRLDICCLKNPAYVPSEMPSWIPGWLEVGNSCMGWQLISLLTKQRVEKLQKAKAKRETGKPEKNITINATNNTSATMLILDSTLRIKGMLFDTVSGLSSVAPFSSKTIKGPIKEYRSLPYSTTVNPYGTTIQTYKAICQTLAMGEGVSAAAVRHFPKMWTADGQKAMQRVEPWLLNWLRANENFQIAGKTLRQWADLPRSRKRLGIGTHWLGGQLLPENFHDSTLKGFIQALNRVVRFDRRILVTEKGYIGMVHPQARPGDKVCLIMGCGVPLILREDVNGFRLVGEAYVHGIMHGEAMANGKAAWRDLDIY